MNTDAQTDSSLLLPFCSQLPTESRTQSTKRVFSCYSWFTMVPSEGQKKRYAENSYITTRRMQLVENNSSKLKGGKLIEN